MREDCCGYTAAVSCFISGKTYHYSRYVCAGKLRDQDSIGTGPYTEVSMNLEEKYQKLEQILAGYGSAAIAFSGGVDSTFLMYAAREALGDRACAITANAEAVPDSEIREAVEYCAACGIRHKVLTVTQMDIPGFAENSEERCYLCKKVLFGQILNTAAGMGCAVVAEGSNSDDDHDYRPGMRAIRELGVMSPLREAHLSKADIRALSRQFHLPTSSKPSFACLATRIPYGDKITEQKLRMAELGEQYLRELGFAQVRVRVHDTMARIEVAQTDIGRLAAEPVRSQVYERLREIGFTYICADLKGYRTGSMNEVLDESVLHRIC